MTSIFENAITHTLLLLKNEPFITEDLIKKKVDLVLAMLQPEGASEPVDRVKLVKTIEAKCEAWQGTPTVIEDRGDHRDWLPDKRSQIEWRFWRRYRRYLEEEKNFFEKSVVTLDDLTDRVLERLEDPKREGLWDRRGLVVGEVQSGKTANYTGLICKAADAGYKLIIVLAGLHNNLRSQTQMRLDEGFLGRDTQNDRAFAHENLRIGVGKLPGVEFFTVLSLTSSHDKGDFTLHFAKQAGVDPGGSDPVLLVVKKQKSVLKNLINWAISVRGKDDPVTGKKTVPGIPLLVIDDEADNASVNTKAIPRDENGVPNEDYEVTAINGRIRALLDHFEQSAYIGYTATPYANIFIYPRGESRKYGRDLFPRDFIINLPPPPNYTGPSQLFGIAAAEDSALETQSGLPLIRKINDYTEFIPDKHKPDHKPGKLPASLVEAIKIFILSCAARRARDERQHHNSMLIHVTRYIAVQKEVGIQVSEELTRTRRRLEYSEYSLPDRIYDEMEELWNSDFVPTTAEILDHPQVRDPLISPLGWEEVRPFLYDAASRIQVKLINGSAGDILDYSEHPDGLSIIAIGGDKLSRGLTLEGLSVSYYLRAAGMYDTLLQMGRWFGFRLGYIDLCRLYTSSELVEWYRYIALAAEELRKEFDYMALRDATPDDYGLRVRTHPEGLLITAVNKMRSGTIMKVSFGDSLIETVVFHREPEIIRNNRDVIEQAVRSLGPPSDTPPEHHFVWKNVPATTILDIIESYRVHPDCRQAMPDSLNKYIKKRNTLGELTHWTVVLINNSKAKTNFKVGDYSIGPTRRIDMHPESPKYALTHGHLIDPKHELIDLTPGQVEEALAKMIRDKDKKEKDDAAKIPKYPSGPYIRECRPAQQGLLLVYPLEYPPKSKDEKKDRVVEEMVMGLAFSISRSHSKGDDTVEYSVNNTYWEQEFGG